MKDRYKELMFRSFKDAMDIVADYNEWSEEAFEQDVRVPPQAVPQIALMLYQSRIQGELVEGGDFGVPDFNDKMYE